MLLLPLPLGLNSRIFWVEWEGKSGGLCINWAIKRGHEYESESARGKLYNQIFWNYIYKVAKKNPKNWYAIDVLSAIFILCTVVEQSCFQSSCRPSCASAKLLCAKIMIYQRLSRYGQNFMQNVIAVIFSLSVMIQKKLKVIRYEAFLDILFWGKCF